MTQDDDLNESALFWPSVAITFLILSPFALLLFTPALWPKTWAAPLITLRLTLPNGSTHLGVRGQITGQQEHYLVSASTPEQLCAFRPGQRLMVEAGQSAEVVDTQPLSGTAYRSDQVQSSEHENLTRQLSASGTVCPDILYLQRWHSDSPQAETSLTP